MILARLTEVTYGLWWSGVTCTVAAAAVTLGAARGIPEYRPYRFSFGFCVGVIATSYWLDMFGVFSPAINADVRRGVGWVMWPIVAALGFAWARTALMLAQVRHRLQQVADDGD